MISPPKILKVTSTVADRFVTVLYEVPPAGQQVYFRVIRKGIVGPPGLFKNGNFYAVPPDGIHTELQFLIGIDSTDKFGTLSREFSEPVLAWSGSYGLVTDPK